MNDLAPFDIELDDHFGSLTVPNSEGLYVYAEDALDRIKALEAEVERLRAAIRDFINATTSRASGTWSTDDVRALRALRATLEASHDPNDSK